MKYEEEIKEIREMMDSISNTGIYARKLDDEELSDGVTYLYTKDTGLSKDIIVDSAETYKYFNHPLCIYVVEDNNVFPIVVSQTPFTPFKQKVSPDIIMFVQHFASTLKELADMDIDSGDFFDMIEQYRDNLQQPKKMVIEMSNYGPDKTGLPIWVYVDDTGSYLNSGHNGSYRMKFQQDKGIKNPRLWMPIMLPDMIIMDGNVPPCKEPQKNVNLVLKWAKGNLELLLKLRDKEITGREFKEQMKTMREITVITDSECR